jgi:uncharacterized membrane protein (UPF0127 family)
MKSQVQIINHSHALASSLQARYCQSFTCRLRGLTFRCRLAPEKGLLLVQARESRSDAGIHMFFVFMDLGVIWINAQGLVVDLKLAKAWRSIIVPQAPAQYVLEVAPQRLNEFEVGDRLTF